MTWQAQAQAWHTHRVRAGGAAKPAARGARRCDGAAARCIEAPAVRLMASPPERSTGRSACRPPTTAQERRRVCRIHVSTGTTSRGGARLMGCTGAGLSSAPPRRVTWRAVHGRRASSRARPLSPRGVRPRWVATARATQWRAASRCGCCWRRQRWWQRQRSRTASRCKVRPAVGTGAHHSAEPWVASRPRRAGGGPVCKDGVWTEQDHGKLMRNEFSPEVRCRKQVAWPLRPGASFV